VDTPEAEVMPATCGHIWLRQFSAGLTLCDPVPSVFKDFAWTYDELIPKMLLSWRFTIAHIDLQGFSLTQTTAR
jgi:hypothetical protein